MKDRIAMPIAALNKENIFDDQMRYEFLKFEITKFSIYCLVSKTRERKNKKNMLENKVKFLEQDSHKNEHKQEHLDCKQKLNDIFDQNVEDINIRSKCKRYKEGEKN